MWYDFNNLLESLFNFKTQKISIILFAVLAAVLSAPHELHGSDVGSYGNL